MYIIFQEWRLSLHEYKIVINLNNQGYFKRNRANGVNPTESSFSQHDLFRKKVTGNRALTRGKRNHKAFVQGRKQNK